MTDLPDEELEPTLISRDQLLKLVGAAGVAIAAGGAVRVPLGTLGTQSADAAALACVLTPDKTEGPYFVDERLNRSDIRVDPSNGSLQPGVPLRLAITVLDMDNACAPVAGAAVDIWHANLEGRYSDVADNGTSGRKYLRGYQVTDANGAVQFTTVYPGWYAGRAIHIHFKIRKFDGSSTTYEFTSQIFFDESVNNAVLAQGPYSARGQADTPNSADNIYGTDGGELTATVTPDGSGGYNATFAVGVTGLAGAAGGAPNDTTVTSSLSGARFGRNPYGTRVLTLTLAVDEAVTADARVVRGARTLVRRAGKRASAGDAPNLARDPTRDSAWPRTSQADAARQCRELTPDPALAPDSAALGQSSSEPPERPEPEPSPPRPRFRPRPRPLSSPVSVRAVAVPPDVVAGEAGAGTLVRVRGGAFVAEGGGALDIVVGGVSGGCSLPSSAASDAKKTPSASNPARARPASARRKARSMRPD